MLLRVCILFLEAAVGVARANVCILRVRAEAGAGAEIARVPCAISSERVSVACNRLVQYTLICYSSPYFNEAMEGAPPSCFGRLTSRTRTTLERLLRKM